jgi:hypothetical protein
VDVSLAVIRPDGWGLPLLVHVAGSTVLVGSLVVVACLALARHAGDAALVRLGFATLFVGAVPGFVLMRAGAEWIKSKEHVPDDPSWIGIGYGVSDLGLLLLVVASVLAGLATRRLRRGPERASGLTTAVAVLVGVNLVGYAVAIWAMTTKPG